MVFMAPPHPPVPEGRYPCPKCIFHPGQESYIISYASGGGRSSFRPCGFCSGSAHVAERRDPDYLRRTGQDRRKP